MNCISSHASIPSAVGKQKRDLVSDGVAPDHSSPLMEAGQCGLTTLRLLGFPVHGKKLGSPNEVPGDRIFRKQHEHTNQEKFANCCWETGTPATVRPWRGGRNMSGMLREMAKASREPRLLRGQVCIRYKPVLATLPGERLCVCLSLVCDLLQTGHTQVPSAQRA